MDRRRRNQLAHWAREIAAKLAAAIKPPRRPVRALPPQPTKGALDDATT